MIIKVLPDGTVEIHSDEDAINPGFFPVHCNKTGPETYEKADHTAAEIAKAIDSGLCPELFVHENGARTLLYYYCTDWKTDEGKFCYEFGVQDWQDDRPNLLLVDEEGNVTVRIVR